MKKSLTLCLLILCWLVFFLAQPAQAATLSLSPTTKNVNLNEQFTLTVTLDTEGVETDGADVLLTYNSTYLSLVSASLGSLYDTAVTNNTTTAGKVTLSAVASSGTTYTGSGTFATLTFKPIKTGSSSVLFTYTSGSTTDSNITSNQTDVLDTVTSATITIRSNGATTYTAPESGVVSWTLGLIVIGFGGLGLSRLLKV